MAVWPSREIVWPGIGGATPVTAPSASRVRVASAMADWKAGDDTCWSGE